jgi:hypothetical protein
MKDEDTRKRERSKISSRCKFSPRLNTGITSPKKVKEKAEREGECYPAI